MTTNLNSASRILKILKEIPSIADNTQVAEVWAKTFSIYDLQPYKRAVAVTQLLRAMHLELGIAFNGLTRARFSLHLYESEFEKVEAAISPLHLPHTWNNVKQHLTPEVFKALEFCAEILPDEEGQISVEDMSSIQKHVCELKEVLSAAAIPERLRLLIEHHICLIEDAIFQYKIVGVKALREASRTASGEIIEVRDEILASKDEPAIKKLDETWKRVNIVADVALKTEKLVSLAERAWESISGFI